MYNPETASSYLDCVNLPKEPSFSNCVLGKLCSMTLPSISRRPFCLTKSDFIVEDKMYGLHLSTLWKTVIVPHLPYEKAAT